MKIVITGASGQLGRELQEVLTEKGFDLYSYSSSELDVTNPRQVEGKIMKIYPNWVINCAAITDVDHCERIPKEAFLVNGLGPQNIASACLKISECKFIQISTNAVFDGIDRQISYKEHEQPTPETISVYAASKLCGELAVKWLLNERGYVIRTSWLYGKYGKKNFVKTILKLSKNNVPLEIVTDEVAVPTLATDLALAILDLIEKSPDGGIYHLINEGTASRYDFAKTILKISGRGNYPVVKTTLSKYLSKNPRLSLVPKYSPLENTKAKKLGIILPKWEESLKIYLDATD